MKVLRNCLQNFNIGSDLECFIFDVVNVFYNICSSYVPPLFLEVFISHLLGLLMGTVAKCIKVEFHYLSLCHLLY